MTRPHRLARGMLLRRIHTSLWFVPALLVLFAVILSSVLLWLDTELGTIEAGRIWVFGGNASGARTVLSVIAGSLITVVAVAFSVTMIAIQQASMQLSPRVLRNFTQDRGNQFVLGTYIATFTYALLVLRRVREQGEGGGEFVPSLSIAMAMVLALTSLGLLVYFIHHAAEGLRVGAVLTSIRRELDREIERGFPAGLGPAPFEPEHRAEALAELRATCTGPSVKIRAGLEGYVSRIDADRVAKALGEGVRGAVVWVQVGDYVCPTDLLLEAWWDAPPDRKVTKRVRRGFRLDRQRTLRDDPLFGVRQLVDVALKALSPGINDPTTAVESIQRLSGVVTLLLGREFPSPVRRTASGAILLFRAPTFAEYVDAAFTEIRRAARNDLRVSLRLLDVLRRLAEQAPRAARAVTLREAFDETLRGVDAARLTEGDRARLRALARTGVDDGEGRTRRDQAPAPDDDAPRA